MEKPWKEEPNYLDWVAHGMTCAVRRHPELGNLMGYVVLQPGHVFYGKYESQTAAQLNKGFSLTEILDGTAPEAHTTEIDDLIEELEVHGGVTCSAPSNTLRVEPPLPKGWVIGFDCSHSYDLLPHMREIYRQTIGHVPDSLYRLEQSQTYRNIGYVKQETELLAKQLAMRVEWTGESLANRSSEKNGGWNGKSSGTS